MPMSQTMPSNPPSKTHSANSANADLFVLVPADVLQRVIAEAMRTGGDFAEVFIEDRANSSALFDDGRVEELTSGAERGAGIRVISGDTTGFAHTADLTESGLLAAAVAAAAAAKGGGGGVKTVALTRRIGTKIHQVVTPSIEIPKLRKVELLQRADAAARAKGAAIRQVTAGYGDSRRRILVANSEGVLAGDEQIRTRLMVQCVALGDTGMQTGYDVAAKTIGWELFDEADVESIAATAAQRALTKLDARPAPSGVMTIVLNQGAGGTMFHEACGHGLEADLVLKDTSVFRNRVGQQVASKGVTIVDDGTYAKEWGTSSIDDEGHPTQRNVLIEDGVLTDYMWDRRHARKEGHAQSGNGRRQNYQSLPIVRMTNTYLLAGQEHPESIISSTQDGIYCAKLGGGQVNTATGDFVFGMVEAYRIENGQLTEPLRDANLIGNGPNVLQAIDAIGNDFATGVGTCGKDGQGVPVSDGNPTLRVVGAITVGGTAS
jgi:TldD protein